MTYGEQLWGQEKEEAADAAAGRDAVGIYLDQMGRHPLLTQEDETALAHRIRDGRRARDELAGGGADPARRRRLRRTVRDGEAARDRFVEANLRLVVSVARRYQHRGLDLADLIQEGNLGLLRAVERFDGDLGFRFSTYATWWIRQAVTRGLASAGATIRLPVHAHEQAAAVVAAREELTARLGRSPNVSELAAEAGLTPEDVVRLEQTRDRPASLSSPVGEGDAELGDLVPDARSGTETVAVEDVFLSEVRDAVGGLRPAEARVLTLRYGLDTGEPAHRDDIARAMGISRERVRQIESRALAHLRSSPALAPAG